MTTNHEQEAPQVRYDQALKDEQAADLAALRAAAEQGSEIAPISAAEQDQAPAGPDLAQELQGLVSMAVVALGPIWPSLTRIYTDDVVQPASKAIAAVCNKHGWLSDGITGRWGEEIACAAIVGPLALATYKGIQEDNAARAAAEKTAALKAPDGAQVQAWQSNPAAPGKTVTFGAPMPAEGGTA